MAVEPQLVRRGMDVYTADGAWLGTVLATGDTVRAGRWYGLAGCWEIAPSEIANVTLERVVLTVPRDALLSRRRRCLVLPLP